MQKKYWLMYICILIFFVIGIFFDNQIVKFITNNRINSLNGFMAWVSYGGAWVVVLLIMTSLFLWTEKKRKWILPLWLSVGIAAIITFSLKLLIMRERPFDALNIINLIPETDSSFPSGHATAVFSTLAVLDKEFPKLVWFWVGFACFIAFTRLYLGVHYLSDLAAGAFVGLSVGLIVVHLFGKYKILGKNW
jgi:undecaprenyl-diphosphatase